MDLHLKDNIGSIKDGTYINSIVKYMISIIAESVSDEEPNEELGYTKQRNGRADGRNET